MSQAKQYFASRKSILKETFDFTVGETELKIQLPLDGMTLLDLGELGTLEGLEAMAALKALFKSILGDDYKKFDAAVKRERLDLEDLMQIFADVIEVSTGRPLERQVSLQATQSTTGDSLAAN